MVDREKTSQSHIHTERIVSMFTGMFCLSYLYISSYIKTSIFRLGVAIKKAKKTSCEHQNNERETISSATRNNLLLTMKISHGT